MSDLETLLDRLLDHDVRFVVVGGFAAMAQGSSLLTRDLDVCIPFIPWNLERLIEAIRDLHPVHRTPDRQPLELSPARLGELTTLRLDTDYGPLDCVDGLDGIGSYEDVRATSDLVDVDHGQCRVLSLDGIILSMEKMARQRDLPTLVELRAIQERVASGS